MDTPTPDFRSVARRRVATLSIRQRVLGFVGASALLSTFVLFILAPPLTVFPLAVLAVIVSYGWYAEQARTAQGIMFLMTLMTVVVMVLITLYLFRQSIPVLQTMGIDILLRTDGPFWEPSQDEFSLVPMLWGTIATTVIATLVAAPLGVTIAIFIAEIAPSNLREVVKPAVEMLAGIPSIVYGFIGYVIINRYMQQHLGLSSFGSLFVVGVVVGLMALPTVASVAEDAISSVPRHMKDGALALGATEWQTIRSVTMPASISGVSAAVLLGVGRAVGETMAATVILGNVAKLPEPLYNVFGNTITLTSLIASQYGNATDAHLQALFAAGVVLFVTVLLLSIASQRIEAHMTRKLGGEL